MKNLDLTSLGLEEMSEVQMQEVGGGIMIYDDGSWGCLLYWDEGWWIMPGSEWYLA